MTKTISIIIINKNDVGIEDTLTALKVYNSKKNIEIVIVDASNHRLDKIYAKFPFIKKYDYKPRQKVRKSSIPEQRNYAVGHAMGDIIVFIDASCIPGKGWLNYLTEPILGGKEDMVCGSTISKGRTTHHDMIAVKNRKTSYLGEAPTINLALSRKLFENINGFDESFDYGSDIDFSWRTTDAGYKIYNQPLAIVSHDWGEPRDEIKRSFKYGRARMYLFIKHPSKRHHVVTQNIGMIIYPLYVLLIPLALVVPWYPLIILIPFIKNIRYRPFLTLADHFTYGFGGMYELLQQIKFKWRRGRHEV